jgi:hypothetical protein
MAKKNIWGDPEKNQWGDILPEAGEMDSPEKLNYKEQTHEKSDGTAFINDDELVISEKIAKATDVKEEKKKVDTKLEEIHENQAKVLSGLALEGDASADIQARLIKSGL